ncbi:DUF3017 domain-containing protein [Pseudonocardia broussonetiae]|uniref:DUF3017 domain-containing protein n=1 Tax=Pseudonocardia broussonetiae TaxID=2736640 RepID=A0A6M6JHB3_9PSEU|nr:DUF3017 domain-containing protein [Pseudonocardia broussonetiae]QJY46563.1 DUF3017 domain-containing protein [Pseudonocardia broussonetiae]
MRTRLPVWAPTALVLLIAAAGLVRVLMEHWRQGGVLLGGALLVAAVLRVALPPEQAGLLVIRSRVLDVVCYVVPGIVMVLLAVTITRGQLTLA